MFSCHSVAVCRSVCCFQCNYFSVPMSKLLLQFHILVFLVSKQLLHDCMMTVVSAAMLMREAYLVCLLGLRTATALGISA